MFSSEYFLEVGLCVDFVFACIFISSAFSLNFKNDLVV
jgi:hypothetical protein